MRQEISIGLSQRLVVTPELRQSIEILQMSAVELKAAIEREHLENPTLELEYFEEPPQIFDAEKIFEPPDTSTTAEKFLMEQAVFAFAAEELSAAKFLIGALDASGYLTISLAEAAKILHAEENFLSEILRRVQRLEPAGVAARNLSECLRLQAERKEIYSGLVAAIIDKHLEEVAAHKIKNIARAENSSAEEVRRAIEIIRGLNPRPLIAYGGEVTKFIVPDVRVTEGGEIFLNGATLPRVKISETYSDLKDFDAETKNYLNRHLTSARQLLRSIRQREKTLLRVVEAIVRRQKDFLRGGRKFLKPMTMRELAEELELHESTVSRAVANKFMEVPFGVVELRKIFSAGVSSEEVTAEKIKALLVELIKSEDPRSPLSDKALAEILSARGISIARRTVMKYREQLKILSSAKRRN
ncbi:MAG: RNA polymerase factor sigma-54 [Selenomonadaceae bacterium]|nr:RNA polymerase factor sigma-54 [Selenomonadaceae bacterium]MBQ3725692.1 RNA polymerase factor sigma-54 [Selenomonadaceae bacterium]MBQ9496266.1 RNA polymerase factor sigma-54 [Selenomonadaceae bacterium]